MMIKKSVNLLTHAQSCRISTQISDNINCSGDSLLRRLGMNVVCCLLFVVCCLLFVVMLLCCYVVMLLCCYVVMLLCCYVVMLLCCYVVMLLGCYVVMLLCCSVVLLFSCSVVMFFVSYCSIICGVLTRHLTESGSEKVVLEVICQLKTSQ